MSDRPLEPPADTLLLRERRRRLRGDAQSVAGEEVLLVESDAIVDESELAITAGAAAEGIALYRPLGLVSFARISWSGAVDHDALQNAIVCSPPMRGGAARRIPGWLAAVSTFALGAAPSSEAALFVALAPDDVALLDRIGTRLTRADGVALVRAAALPDSIVGADAATVSGASTVLSAYRRATLVHAWEIALCGSAAPDSARERDASAVQLLSMLRALVGEI